MGDFFRGNGKAPDHSWSSAKEFYKMQYFEAIDLIVTQVEQRFDQETLRFLSLIEDIVIGAANGRECSFDKKLEQMLDRDVDLRKLQSEFVLLSSFVKEVEPGIKEVTSINTVIDCLKKKRLGQLLSEISTLIKLYLTIPLSNATAERSFSTLRRVKTYLRSRLTQEHLNHFIMLHGHKDLTDKICPKSVARSFVSCNERRQAFFGRF